MPRGGARESEKRGRESEERGREAESRRGREERNTVQKVFFQGFAWKSSRKLKVNAFTNGKMPSGVACGGLLEKIETN